MKRDPAALGVRPYDVLVVGAGIHGACVARDAALRGMRVALIDRGDFGGATSHNSLKLIHGGLRYLQHADLRRVRESIRERRFWLRAAPHLVRPLKFVIPLYGWGLKGPIAMWAAMRVYNLLALGRNRGVREDRRIPRAHLISKREMMRLAPGIDTRGLSGGAVWHDGQMLDADRVLLECVRDATAAGADAANYVEADGAILGDGALKGMRVTDRLAAGSKDPIEISARVTINAAGPWIEKLVGLSGASSTPRHDGLHKGMNLVVPKVFDHDVAVGVVRLESDALVKRGGRLFFITPWRDRSVIGTSHIEFHGEPDDFGIGNAALDADVQAFLDEVNRAVPGVKLTRGDVAYCYAGLTPAERGQRSRKTELRDHGQGLISVGGVKYTTARLVAERAVDLAAARLGGGFPPCVTETTPLPDSFKLDSTSPDTTLMDRVVLAVREEMAVRLSDFVWRRMNRTHVESLSSKQLDACAEQMAKELGWDAARRERELRDVQKCAATHHGAPEVVS